MVTLANQKYPPTFQLNIDSFSLVLFNFILDFLFFLCFLVTNTSCTCFISGCDTKIHPYTSVIFLTSNKSFLCYSTDKNHENHVIEQIVPQLHKSCLPQSRRAKLKKVLTIYCGNLNMQYLN